MHSSIAVKVWDKWGTGFKRTIFGCTKLQGRNFKMCHKKYYVGLIGLFYTYIINIEIKECNYLWVAVAYWWWWWRWRIDGGIRI
jgi:hypothetical protein